MGDEGGSKVALIDVRGLIADRTRSSFLSPGSNPVDELAARLEKAQKDADVKAVILRINSPGGTVSASDTMYREVRRFREKTGKPVVVSMSELAASGGYYLSLSGDEIFAQPTTITGSIGVIIPSINISEGLKKIGVVSRSIKSGVNKDLANPLEPMREGQYAVLQGMVDEFYARFKGLVVERRGRPQASESAASESRHWLDMSRLADLTDGRVVTGAEAVKAGLADREGDLRDAFERAKTLAGMSGGRLVKYHTDGDRPRSAYAEEEVSPRMGVGDTNLVKVEMGNLGLGELGGMPYYLWMPGQ